MSSFDLAPKNKACFYGMYCRNKNCRFFHHPGVKHPSLWKKNGQLKNCFTDDKGLNCNNRRCRYTHINRQKRLNEETQKRIDQGMKEARVIGERIKQWQLEMEAEKDIQDEELADWIEEEKERTKSDSDRYLSYLRMLGLLAFNISRWNDEPMERINAMCEIMKIMDFNFNFNKKLACEDESYWEDWEGPYDEYSEDEISPDIWERYSPYLCFD